MSLPTVEQRIALMKELLARREEEGSMGEDEAALQRERYIKSEQPMVIVDPGSRATPDGFFMLVPTISPEFVISRSRSAHSLARYCWENDIHLVKASEYS